MLWISAAGPLANMILALISGILLRFIAIVGATNQHSIIGLLIYAVFMSLRINLALAIFNLLPIAPLDGSKILFGLLPVKHEGKIYFLVGRVTDVHILGGLIWPFVKFFSKIFSGI